MPIIYADTVGYFHSGEGTLNVLTNIARGALSTSGAVHNSFPIATDSAVGNDDGITTARSVFYGFIFVTAYHALGIWAMLVLQVAVTVSVLRAALTQLGEAGSRKSVAIIAATGLAGAAAFTNTLAPDLFAGLAVLAAAILMARYATLSTVARWAWFGVIVAGCLFHKSIVAIILLMAAYGGVALGWRRQHLGGVVWLGGALAIGLVAMVAVNIAVERVGGQPPVDPPFLLARVIGDGTAGKYLTENCPTRRFELCRYELPTGMTENNFLWGRTPPHAVVALMSRRERLKLNAEASAIVAGTVQAYPIEQAIASTTNFARQLVLVGIREFGVSPGGYAKDKSALRPDLLRYARQSAVARGAMPLGLISWLMSAAYFASLATLVLIAAVHSSRAQISRPVWRAVEFVVAGVIANAAVCGIIGGVFDRYQGRVAWLFPFTALCLVATLYNGRRSTTTAPVALRTPPPARAHSRR